jgi:hypothetical protein
MRNPLQKIAIASALIVVAGGIPALYAQDHQDQSGSMMERRAIDHDRTTGQRGGMMDSCAGMMQSRGNDGGRPNDQWRNPAPSNPDQKG